MNNILTKIQKPTYFVDGAELRSWRMSAGLGLRKLAKALQVSPTYLSRIETAPKQTRVGAAFAHKLGVITEGEDFTP